MQLTFCQPRRGYLRFFMRNPSQMPGTVLLAILVPATDAEHSASDITSQSLEFYIGRRRRRKVLWINKSFNLILREITNSDFRNQNKKKYWELFTDLSWVAWRSRAAITGVCGFNSRAERWFIQSTHWLAATQRISEVSHCCSQYTFRSQFIPGWMLPSNNKCSEMHYTNIHISGNEWKAA